MTCLLGPVFGEGNCKIKEAIGQTLRSWLARFGSGLSIEHSPASVWRFGSVRAVPLALTIAAPFAVAAATAVAAAALGVAAAAAAPGAGDRDRDVVGPDFAAALVDTLVEGAFHAHDHVVRAAVGQGRKVDEKVLPPVVALEKAEAFAVHELLQGAAGRHAWGSADRPNRGIRGGLSRELGP